MYESEGKVEHFYYSLYYFYIYIEPTSANETVGEKTGDYYPVCYNAFFSLDNFSIFGLWPNGIVQISCKFLSSSSKTNARAGQNF